jgi:hypothetical protein
MAEPAPREARSAGCLTAQELALVEAAAPGKAPAALAQHLATCALCQERALFGAARRLAGRDAPKMPSLQRAIVLLVVMLAALGVFLFSLQSVVGRLRLR